MWGNVGGHNPELIYFSSGKYFFLGEGVVVAGGDVVVAPFKPEFNLKALKKKKI